MQRRDFMKWASLVGASSFFFKASEVGAQVVEPMPTTQVNPYAPHDFRGLATNPEAYTFFTGEEAKFIEAAIDRILPKDESGPGALEAGVAYFMDQQLAGSFGQAARWYMQGPWATGTPMQGYQLPFTPAEVYRAGISVTNHYAQAQQKKDFWELTGAQQDSILKDLEGGKVSDPNVPVEVSKQFFAFLLQNTIEGFLADPAYGGNRNKTGWQQIGFPGVYLEMYGDFIDKANATLPKLVFIGLADAQRTGTGKEN